MKASSTGDESNSGKNFDGNKSRGGVLAASSYIDDSPTLVDPNCRPPAPAPPVVVLLLKSPPLEEAGADPRMLGVGRRLFP